MKILNDKFGLSYLAGNAQVLYANTASLQQFDTIIANTFTTTGNVFTVNVSGVYSNGFFATSGNISAANIIIAGNLFLGTGSGTTGQYIRRSATGISWVDSSFVGGTLIDPTQVNNQLYAQSFSSPNVQIGSNWTTSANANVATANISLGLNATTGNIVTLVATNANVSAALNATSANITTLVVTNLSTSNIAISAGGLQTSYINTGLGGNVTTANLLIIRSGSGTALQVTPTGGSAGVLFDNAAVYTRISNLVGTNASITGTASSIGVRPGGVVDVVSNLYANTGRLEQLSVANLYMATATKITLVANNTVSIGTVGQIPSNVAITGNTFTNSFVYTSAIIEPVAIHAGTAPAGEMPINLMANTTHYYTPNATALWTPNVRAGTTTPLNNMLSIGQSITFSMIINQGATPYNNNSGNLRIDNSWYTAKWPYASAPTAVPNRIEVYTYTLIKTAAGTWVVLASSSTNG